MIKNYLKKWTLSEGSPLKNNMSLCVMALFFGSVSSASAYDWTGNSVDNVLYKEGGTDASRSESDASKVVFLQHVGTGKWLKPGGDWGTQPELGGYATELWICKKNVHISGPLLTGWYRTYYFLNTSLGSSEGSWIGYDRATDENNPATYMDKSKGDDDIYIAWNMVDLGDNKYAIASRYPIKANMNSWSASNVQLYLSYDETTKSIGMKEVDNINNATTGSDGDKRIGDPDVETLKKDPNLQWRIVTMQDIYNALDNTKAASMTEPFDLTFLIKDSGLDRCSYYNKAWTTTVADNGGETGLKLGIENVFSSKLDDDTSDNRYGGPGDINKHGDAYKALVKPLGKYFCGQAKGGSGYDVDGKYFTQNIYCPRTGWYRLSCQGFTDTPSTPSFLYASSGTSSYVRKSLVSIDDFEGEGTTPTDLTDAGKMFYNEQYTNTLYFHANKGELMVIGLQFKGSDSWTAFDDFRLAYCGNDNPQLVLDETKENLNYISNAHSDYNDFKGAILYLHRNMDINKWNTFVAPVDLTMGQVRDLFGNHTKVAKLSYYNNGYMRFDRVESDEATSDSKVVMSANTPYLVMPRISATGGFDANDKATDMQVSYRDKNQTQDSGDQPAIQETCTAPYASTFVTTAVNKDNMGSDKAMTDSKVTCGDMTFHGTLVKTYGTDADGKKYYSNGWDLTGSYIVSEGKLYYVDKNIGLSGLKGYFTLNKNAEAPAKFQFDIDGVCDESEVTGIDQIIGAGIAAKQNVNVYTLDGQLVSTNGSTENLSKGIYIVNGKKQIVK